MSQSKKNKIMVVTFLILLLLSAIFSLTVGKFEIKISGLLSKNDMMTNVFFTLRLPRVLMGAVSGFVLATVGFVYQAVFKNALAAPDIIGVSSGSSAGAAFAILFLGGSAVITSISAFLGGMIALVLALLMVSSKKSRALAGFVLSGIAVNAIMQAVLMTFKLVADPERQLASIEYWTMGSLSGVTASRIPFAIILSIVGTLGLLLLYRQVLLLTMDENEASMLGVPVSRMRAVVLTLATLAAAATVSVTGPISFVGLIAPHISRMLTKSSRLSSCVLSGIIGSIILLLADSAARGLTASELPISIMTTLIGAPFLIYLIKREEKVP